MKWASRRHLHPIEHSIKDMSRYEKKEISERYSQAAKHKVKDRVRY